MFTQLKSLGISRHDAPTSSFNIQNNFLMLYNEGLRVDL